MKNEELVKFISIYCKPTNRYNDLINLTSSINSTMNCINNGDYNYTTEDVLEATRKLSIKWTREKFGRTEIKVHLIHNIISPILCGMANWNGKKEFIEENGCW